MVKPKMPRTAEEIAKDQPKPEPIAPVALPKGKRVANRVASTPPPAGEDLIQTKAPEPVVQEVVQPKIQPVRKARTASAQVTTKRIKPVKRSAAEIQKITEPFVEPPKIIESVPHPVEDPQKSDITYAFSEDDIHALVSSIVEGLSSQFITKDEAANVVIGTLQKIAMKDNPKIEEPIEEVVEEEPKKEGFISRLFKRSKGG